MPSPPADWLHPHGGAQPVIDPETHMRTQAARRGGDPDARCPAVVMGGFIPPMLNPMLQAAQARASKLHASLHVGRLDGHDVGAALIPIGAARSVMLLEELIALGARTVLIAGAVGALRQNIGLGEYVVPTSARREEGASYHYAPPGRPARAVGAAVRALAAAARASGRAVHLGPVWTTDAPYREFSGKVRSYAAAGVLGVDMETSALMVVAEFRRVDLGLVLTVSDVVCRPDWPNIFGTDDYRANCAHTARVVVHAARQLLPESNQTGTPSGRPC